jgi:hypothetical protein
LVSRRTRLLSILKCKFVQSQLFIWVLYLCNQELGFWLKLSHVLMVLTIKVLSK